MRVALDLGDRRLDVAVSGDSELADVLAASGIDPRSVRVVDATGEPFDLELTLSEQLATGDVLWVLARTPLPSGAAGGPGAKRAGAQAGAPRRTTAGSAGWLAGATALSLCLVIVASRALVLLRPDAVLVPDAARFGLAGVLAAAAIFLAVHRSGDQGGRAVADSHLLDETIVAPFLALTAAFLLAPGEMYAAARTAVVLGLVAGASVAALRYAVSRQLRDPSEAVAAMLAAIWVVVAAVFALALLTGVPSSVAPTLILGAVPLLLRVLPSAALEVPEEQLIDVPYVIRTAGSVRAPEPKPPGRVIPRRVEQAVSFAERRKGAGIVAASLLAVVMAPAVIGSFRPGTLPGWGTTAVLAFVVIFLGLSPRAARGSLAKGAPRVAMAVLLLFLAVAVIRGTFSAAPHTVALLLIPMALLVAGLSVIFVRGWRSVAWSRIGDIIESIAVVLVLPAALISAGAIEGLGIWVAG